MVDGLRPQPPPSPRPAGSRVGRRGLAFLALIAMVASFHVVVARDLAARLADAASAQAMPARIEIAYVRTLEPEVPRPMAAPTAAAAEKTPPRRASRAAQQAAAAAASAAASAALAAELPVPIEPAVPVAEVAVAASAPSAPAAAAEAAASQPAAVAAAEAPASAPAGSFSWPAGTRVSYALTGYWRGELSGSAEVEWIRVGARYQVNVDIRAGPSFAPIFTRRMTSEGSLGEAGLVPDKYDEDTQVLMADRRRVSVGFEPDAIVLANGQRRERLAGVQDTASQFIQFTWLFGSDPDRLQVGRSFEFPLALPRSMNRWTYDVAEQQTLYAPFGPLATYHLKPRRETRRPGDWLVEMWFAPELRFLPVRIRIEQEAGAFVDLMIARKPELAAS